MLHYPRSLVRWGVERRNSGTWNVQHGSTVGKWKGPDWESGLRTIESGDTVRRLRANNIAGYSGEVMNF